MRKRFVTVHQEMRSLRQYVAIYRKIYDTDLNVEYLYEGDAGKAYIPTMIIQPLLENALIHGIDPQRGAHIRIRAAEENGQMIIHIDDNGQGMTQETINRILNCRNDHPTNKEEKTSLGVRNVLDRLHLLFGDEAGLCIHCVPNEGTRVTINMPVHYSLPEDKKLQS